MSASDDDMARKVAAYGLSPHEIQASEREGEARLERLKSQGLSGRELYAAMLIENAEAAGVSVEELIAEMSKHRQVLDFNK